MSLTSYLFLALMMAVPSRPAPQPEADARAQQVVLKVGEENVFDGGRVQIRFETVLSDSRCPRGVRCIQAGEAKVQVWVKEGSEPGRSHVVAGPAPVFSPVSRSYSVRIKSLDPYPEPGRAKTPEHILKLLVLKTSL
jgi:hypothetical protein